MKTLLPEKIKGEIFEMGDFKGESLSTGDNTINQIITYLAELTEVVEGKQTKRYTGLDERGFETSETVKQYVPYEVTDTPTLKEQLLGEIAELPNAKHWNYDKIEGYEKARQDVEAIINRLIK
jgi:hypothetical protein